MSKYEQPEDENQNMNGFSKKKYKKKNKRARGHHQLVDESDPSHFDDINQIQQSVYQADRDDPEDDQKSMVDMTKPSKSKKSTFQFFNGISQTFKDLKKSAFATSKVSGQDHQLNSNLDSHHQDHLPNHQASATSTHMMQPQKQPMPSSPKNMATAQMSGGDLRMAQNKEKRGSEDRKNGKAQKKQAKLKPIAKNNGIGKNVPIKDPALLQNLQNKVIVKQGEQRDKEIEERNKEEKQCDLCQRPWPIFVAETDDMIKRLPERFLSPLLKSLKKDFNNKRQYLKFLRISVKYIKACNCEDKNTHQYCLTAQVVRSQKIYCKDCGAYYHLYVKSEKLCSSQLFAVIGRYICLFILLIVFAQCTLLLDSFLKQNHKNNLEQGGSDSSGSGKTQSQSSVNSTSQATTSSSSEEQIFNVYDIENWIVMAPLTIILGIIMIWCFYFRFMKAVMARKRLIYVEVMDHRNSDIFISRFEAKQNLHLVGEVTQKLRSYNYLFDKYWYMQREFTYIDAISQVEQAQFSNKQEGIITAGGNLTDKDDLNKYNMKDQQSKTPTPGDKEGNTPDANQLTPDEEEPNAGQPAEVDEQLRNNNKTGKQNHQLNGKNDKGSEKGSMPAFKVSSKISSKVSNKSQPNQKDGLTFVELIESTTTIPMKEEQIKDDDARLMEQLRQIHTHDGGNDQGGYLPAPAQPSGQQEINQMISNDQGADFAKAASQNYMKDHQASQQRSSIYKNLTEEQLAEQARKMSVFSFQPNDPRLKNLGRIDSTNDPNTNNNNFKIMQELRMMNMQEHLKKQSLTGTDPPSAIEGGLQKPMTFAPAPLTNYHMSPNKFSNYNFFVASQNVNEGPPDQNTTTGNKKQEQLRAPAEAEKDEQTNQITEVKFNVTNPQLAPQFDYQGDPTENEQIDENKQASTAAVNQTGRETPERGHLPNFEIAYESSLPPLVDEDRVKTTQIKIDNVIEVENVETTLKEEQPAGEQSDKKDAADHLMDLIDLPVRKNTAKEKENDMLNDPQDLAIKRGNTVQTKSKLHLDAGAAHPDQELGSALVDPEADSVAVINRADEDLPAATTINQQPEPVPKEVMQIEEVQQPEQVQQDEVRPDEALQPDEAVLPKINIQQEVNDLWSKYDQEQTGLVDKIVAQYFVNEVLSQKGKSKIQNMFQFNHLFDQVDVNGEGSIAKKDMITLLENIIEESNSSGVDSSGVNKKTGFLRSDPTSLI